MAKSDFDFAADAVVAPDGVHVGAAFVEGHFAGLFEVEAVEDALVEGGLAADDVGGEGFAGGCAADAAVDLREADFHLFDFLHFLECFADVGVEDHHGAGLDFVEDGVVYEVVFVLFHFAVARHFAVAFAFGGFAGAGIHAFAAEEAVVDGEECAGAGLVAGAEFEEFDAFDFVVFEFFEEVHDVFDAVDGVGALGGADAAFAVGEGGEDGVGGEALSGEGFVLVVFALVFDVFVDAVVEEVHVDDAVDEAFFFADGCFDGGDFGGAGCDVEEAYLVARDAAADEFLDGVHGAEVEGDFDGEDVFGEGWVFDLYESNDGGAEGGDERPDVGVLAGVAFFGVFVYHGGAFDLHDVGEAEFLEGGVDARDADVVGELSHEDGREECDGVGVLPDVFEVVVFDADGLGRADFVAASAVDTAVFLYRRFAAVDADGLGGADLHAAGAADAARFVYLESVVKHIANFF